MEGEDNVCIIKKKMEFKIHILGGIQAILKRNGENTC